MDTTTKLAAGLAVAVGGYFAYTQIYEPWALKRTLDEQAKLLMAQNPGMTYASALAAIGAKACQGLGMIYKIPPEKSKDACELASKLATIATIVGTKLTIAAGKYVGKEIGKGAEAVGHGVKVGAKQVVRDLNPINATKDSIHLAEKLKFWGLEGYTC